MSWCAARLGDRGDVGADWAWDQARRRTLVDLLRSQGDYHSLRAVGFTDDELGARAVTDAAERAWAGRPTRPMHFTYRARIGVRHGE